MLAPALSSSSALQGLDNPNKRIFVLLKTGSSNAKHAGEICQCQTHIGIGNTKMTPVCQLVKKWRFSLETLVFLQFQPKFSGTDLVFEVFTVHSRIQSY